VKALCFTYAVSGSCRKWYVAVRMSAYAVLREKTIWVESFGIRKVFWSSVQEVRPYCYVSASRNDVITCWNIEHNADSTASNRKFSHWTQGTIKLTYIADESLLQMRTHSLNTQRRNSTLLKHNFTDKFVIIF